MGFLSVYRQIIDAAKKQLFASVSKNDTDRLKEHLFYYNVSRFSIQSTVLVLMDFGLLSATLLGRGKEEPSGLYIGLMLFKILLMAIFSYLFARTNSRPFSSNHFLHRNIDFLYPTIHAIGELLLFFAGPQDLGAFARLLAVPFIIGGIPIINQFKSTLLLSCFYLIVASIIPRTAYGAFGVPYTTSYNFWAVVFACSLFISYTVYSWFVGAFTARTAAERAGADLTAANARLEDEVDQRTRLLEAVNSISGDLLGSGPEDFDAVLFNCMYRIGATVDADRVYIWKNHMEGDELYCTQTHEWSGGAEPQQGNELTFSVPFPAAWYPNLSRNLCVNGIVRDFPTREREHLEAQDIISIVVVPVFLHDTFWGFVGFDDCKRERLFTDVEEAILRTISLLFATSMLRNEMTTNLINATEAALASSRAKTDFLANMSHEIRTPINAITGMSKMARLAETDTDLYHCLDNIDAASKQLLSIINDILDMSKIEAGKIELAHEPFELLTAIHNIESIIGVQAREKGLTLVSELDPHLPQVVVGDDMRLSQVLINLLANAVKFTPAGGIITFTATRLQSLPEGIDELEFRVRDTGIGIEADKLGSLFGKFEQADRGISRRFGGTGLGLSISKSIVELMQGAIEVASTPGEGSCFTARVRLLTGSPDMIVRRTAGEGPGEDFSGIRALLVEDIEINREIVIAMLASTGITIEEAVNGQVALDRITADPNRYDLIFMDLHMPVMDGYTAAEKIRALPHPAAQQIPIIAMTANAFTEDVRRCLAVGMNDHVAKPINFDELTAKIAAVLGRTVS